MYDEGMTVVTRLKAWIVGVLIWLVLLVAILATAPGCIDGALDKVDRKIDNATDDVLAKCSLIFEREADEASEEAKLACLQMTLSLGALIDARMQEQTATLAALWGQYCAPPAASANEWQ